MAFNRQGVRRGVGAGHVDDRGYGCGAVAGNPAGERARAARAVASMSDSAAECVELLSALGLQASEGLSSERVS